MGLLDKKKSIHYFQVEWGNMRKWLKNYFKTKDQEHLHQFRVQVKKIEAFLILLDFGHHHAKLRPIFKPVRRIFKLAGKLRNASVSQNLLQDGQLLEEAAQCFKLRKRKSLKKIKKVRHKLIRKIKGVNKQAINNFFTFQFQQIQSALNTLPQDQYLHDCRKRIKCLLYNEKIARNALHIRLETEYLDSLQETIGEWHDCMLASAFSEKDSKVSIPLKRKQSILKAKINRLSKNFDNRSIASSR